MSSVLAALLHIHRSGLRITCLVLVSYACLVPSSRAALWDITISGQAFLPDGTTGTETVIYRYDPSQIVETFCLFPDVHCDPGSIFGHWSETGPIYSVHYSGLVNGASGPATLFVTTAIPWDNHETHFGGSVITDLCCTGRWSDPQPVFDAIVNRLSDSDVRGGEDGWDWHLTFNDLAFPYEYRLSVLPVAVPEPSMLLLLLSVSFFAISCYLRTCR